MPPTKPKPQRAYRACLAQDSLYQETTGADLGSTLSFGLSLARLYPDALVWLEREEAGERYLFAVLQGQESEIDE